MIILLSLLICVAGLVMYGFASNPKVQEVGRMMFWCGLLAFLLQDRELVTLLSR